MKIQNPPLRFAATKHLKGGNVVCIAFEEGHFGYAVVFGERQRMWLLDVYSKDAVFCPQMLPSERLKWRFSPLFDQVTGWILATEAKLSPYAESAFYIRWTKDCLGTGEMIQKLYGPRNTNQPATPEEIAKLPQQCSVSDLEEYFQEKISEMELINGKPGWTAVTPEQLALAKKPPRPKPTGEHRIEVFVFTFAGTEIASRNDLEEDIQEEIGDHGFVSGGGSLVGHGAQEGGHVDIECSAEDVAAVLSKVRRVLHRLKAPPTTAIVDATLLDDGTSKDKESQLGEEKK